MTLLLVEDNEDFRTIFSQSLSNLGFNVVCAVDGRDGIEKFREVNPVVVITDLEMPVANGWFVLEHLAGKVPTFMCTGLAFDPDVRDKAIGLGAQGVFEKSEFRKLFGIISKGFNNG